MTETYVKRKEKEIMTEQMNENERSMKYYIIFALVSAVLLPVCGEFYVIGEFYWKIARWLVTAIVFIWTAVAGVFFGRLPIKKAMLGCAAFALSSLVLGMVGFALIHPLFRKGLNDYEEYFAYSFTTTGYYFDWLFYWAKAVAALGLSFIAAFMTFGIKKLASKDSEEDRKTSSAIDNAFSEDEE